MNNEYSVSAMLSEITNCPEFTQGQVYNDSLILFISKTKVYWL